MRGLSCEGKSKDYQLVKWEHRAGAIEQCECRQNKTLGLGYEMSPEGRRVTFVIPPAAFQGARSVRIQSR